MAFGWADNLKREKKTTAFPYRTRTISNETVSYPFDSEQIDGTHAEFAVADWIEVMATQVNGIEWQMKLYRHLEVVGREYMTSQNLTVHL